MEDVTVEENIVKEQTDMKVDVSLLTVTDEDHSRLSFNSFDPVQVLRNGQKLLGSAGKVSLSEVPC
jgi:hypothetical protein